MIYAITKEDGSLAIMRIIKGNINEEIKKWEETQESKAVSFREIKEEDVPSLREYRDAWIDDGKRIKHDMNKARDIQMTRIRKKRDELLEKLDVEQLKGIDVSSQKQNLRDIPQKFDLTKFETLEALSNAMPKELL